MLAVQHTGVRLIPGFVCDYLCVFNVVLVCEGVVVIPLLGSGVRLVGPRWWLLCPGF